MSNKAFKVIDEMDFKPNNVIWTTILAVVTRDERYDIMEMVVRIVNDKLDSARDSSCWQHIIIG